MMVFMLLFPIALIALAVWAIGWLFPSGQRRTGRTEFRQDPGAALALRYARGELSREEFLSIREELL